MHSQKITLCACASRSFIDKEKVARLVTILQTAGKEVEVIPDLCEWIEQRSDRLTDIAASTVVACHSRALKALFDWAGQPTPHMLDMRANEVTTLLTELDLPTDSACPTEQLVASRTLLEGIPKKPGQDAWFPTIDKSRCINCGKCHDFCLFGVYTLEEKKVVVKAPQNCKNNCPACARNCPTQAIIFPKYAQAPINGGEQSEEKAMAIDTAALYNTALRERLAARRASVSLLRKSPKA